MWDSDSWRTTCSSICLPAFQLMAHRPSCTTYNRNYVRRRSHKMILLGISANLWVPSGLQNLNLYLWLIPSLGLFYSKWCMPLTIRCKDKLAHVLSSGTAKVQIKVWQDCDTNSRLKRRNSLCVIGIHSNIPSARLYLFKHCKILQHQRRGCKHPKITFRWLQIKPVKQL